MAQTKAETTKNRGRRNRKDPNKDPVFMAALVEMVIPLLFVRMKGCNAPVMLYGGTFQGHCWDWDEYLQREEQGDWDRHDVEMDFEWSDWAWNDARFDEPPVRPRVNGRRSPNKHSRRRRLTLFFVWRDWFGTSWTDADVRRYERPNGDVPRATPPSDRQRGARRWKKARRVRHRDAERLRETLLRQPDLVQAMNSLDRFEAHENVGLEQDRFEMEYQMWDPLDDLDAAEDAALTLEAISEAMNFLDPETIRDLYVNEELGNFLFLKDEHYNNDVREPGDVSPFRMFLLGSFDGPAEDNPDYGYDSYDPYLYLDRFD